MSSAFNSTPFVLALFAAMAMCPPVPRHATPFNLQFGLGWWINEAPQLGLWWLVAGTLPTLVHSQPSVWWWLVAAFTAVDLGLFTRLALRARSARPALTAALREVYGARGEPRYTRPVWWRLALPVLSWRLDVRRIRNLRYGPARRGNRLDVYVSRRRRAAARPAPVLVYCHGRLANKMLGSRELIYRQAAQGWVCVSAGRRQFTAGYRGELDDTRAALEWVRRNAAIYGGDPDRIVAVGGSGGANVATTAALTGTRVAAVVAFYGYFGDFGGAAGPWSPEHVIGSDAPPFFVVHGTVDSLVPCREARGFAERLRAVSTQPVVFAELPGAQHSFDALRSIRFHAVTDAVVRFVELTVGIDDVDPPPRAAAAVEEGKR